LPLVDYIVAEMARAVPRHVNRDDLVSAGRLGLFQAARSFDATRGTPFATYASRRIRGAVLDELRNTDWATRTVRARFREFQRASDEITARSGREPTRAEVAAAMGVDVQTLNRLLGNVDRASVLNYESIVESGDFESLFSQDDLSPEHHILDREQSGYLRAAIAALPAQHRVVIVGCFFEDRLLRSLATELGVTESRISQIRTEACELLRHALTVHFDREPRPAEVPVGRVARRRAAYCASVADLSDFRSRLSCEQPTLEELVERATPNAA
jgi:RNA polymerase sigma factor for flagellar operon FliA